MTIRFYRHREPSGLALAMREAIPHSWNENRVHLITHEKGPLRNRPLATPASRHRRTFGAVTIIFPVLSIPTPSIFAKMVPLAVKTCFLPCHPHFKYFDENIPIRNEG